jgi:hypothetical protein
MKIEPQTYQANINSETTSVGTGCITSSFLVSKEILGIVSNITSLRKVFDTGHQPMEQLFCEQGDAPDLHNCTGIQLEMKTLANDCHEASIPYPVEIKSFQRT